MANSSNANNLNKQNMGEMNDMAINSSPSFNHKQNQYRNNQALSNLQNTKKQIKKVVLKEGIKKAAAYYGVPEVATEKILNTEVGREILDAASENNPNESAKAITKVVAKRTIMAVLPAILFPFLLLIIIITLIIGKTAVTGMGSANDFYEELRQEIASVSSNYRHKVKIDGNLILATLVAYNSHEDIYDTAANSKNMDYMKKQVSKLASYQVMTNTSCSYDSSTIRKIANNDDWFNEANYNCVLGMQGITTYTLSIDEGEYNDDNSGSTYYWNLIDNDFIFNYYNEYMINKDENTSQNTEKINTIIHEIYSYYRMMDNIEYDTKPICSNGITLDGVTMNFEDYIKGVVYSYVGTSNMNIEAIKAISVAARSEAMSSSNNCTRELHSSTNGQNYQDGYESNIKVVQAVTDTSGQYLTYNDQIFNAVYTNFPDLGSDCNVVCNDNYCSADLSYDINKTLGVHTVTVPRYLNGKDIANDGVGSCVGINKEALEYDSSNGNTYEDILKKYYSSSVEIKSSSVDGLVEENGFLKRVERAQRDNLYYYSVVSDVNRGYIAGGLEGECAWYAVKRTNEIIATMGLQTKYDYVYSGGNGKDFCYASDYAQFDKSTNPNDSTLQPGALISWDSDYHEWGHVAVVEAVYRDSNGNITSIDISEAGISIGQYGVNARTIINHSANQTLRRSENCEKNGTGCQRFRNISIDKIKYNSGSFICYLKIVK